VPTLTLLSSVRHPTGVELLVRRAAALVLALTLGNAGWVECAGWEATPEARMDCCTDGGACPMHDESSEQGTRSTGGVTQAQADSCCAVSGHGSSTPSAPGFSMSLSAALVASPIPSIGPVNLAEAPLDGWRAHVPLSVSEVPKHLLLSVFLI